MKMSLHPCHLVDVHFANYGSCSQEQRPISKAKSGALLYVERISFSLNVSHLASQFINIHYLDTIPTSTLTRAVPEAQNSKNGKDQEHVL